MLEELLPKDNETVGLPIFEPPEKADPIGFAPDQMIRCEECLRANPPTRTSCLYCAATLPQNAASLELQKPTLRPPGKNEFGSNVIRTAPPSNLSEVRLTDAASLLKLSEETLQALLQSQKPMPLARTASFDEAKLVVDRLMPLGVQSLLLNDEVLGATQSGVVRVRAISFEDHSATFHHSGGTERMRFDWSTLELIITGRLVTRKIEVRERKLRKEENEIVSTSEFFADESVIDLYVDSDSTTWRIPGNGFDFSSLGRDKRLLAHENFRTLLNLISTKAPDAILMDDYDKQRQLLDHVWATDQDTQSRGWRREAPGKYSISGEMTESNEMQFTRYSKLQFYFLKNR